MKKYLSAISALFLFFTLPPLLCSVEKKLPRYVSTRTAETNIRVGPGNNYPISWVLLCAHLPIEIIAEFDHWRQIRDWEGTIGWVHKSMLQGKKRYALISRKITLYKESKSTSKALAHIEPRVICHILKCNEEWCQIRVSNFTGWVKASNLWGIYPQEKIN